MQHMRIRDGIAVEVMVVPEGMDLAQVYGPSIVSDCIETDYAAAVGWVVAAGGKLTPPSSRSTAPSVKALADQLVSEATRACSAISRQIVPDDTHRTAYANAATIVWGNGGKAPSDDPAKSIFSAQAAALGLSADAFAQVVTSVSLASLQLATLLSAVRGSAGTATSSNDVQTTLAAFESGLATLVSTLNASGLTVTIAPSPPIQIAGLGG